MREHGTLTIHDDRARTGIEEFEHELALIRAQTEVAVPLAPKRLRECPQSVQLARDALRYGGLDGRWACAERDQLAAGGGFMHGGLH